MTSRQFYFILATFVISLKIQKMPCIIYDFLGKDSYILFIVYLVINVVEIAVAFYVSQKIRNQRDDKEKKKKFYDILLKFSCIFIALYFILQSILYYEAIQDLFSHILFDNLSWNLFSIFLLGCVFYLASFTFKNIGRVCEIFFPLMMVSLIILSIFGATNSDFSVVFPFQTIKKLDLFKSIEKFNFWFGDFFIVLILGTKVKDLKFSKTIFTYILSICFVIFLVIEFNGIYLNLASIQPSLISIISEQALLGIDIGRIDWFLILVSEIGTTICSALCLCIAKDVLGKVFKGVNSNIFLIIMIIGIYIADVIFLIDLNIKEKFFMEIVSKFSMIIKLSVLVLSVIKVINIKVKTNNKNIKSNNQDKNINNKLSNEKVQNNSKITVKSSNFNAKIQKFNNLIPKNKYKYKVGV